MVKPLPAGGPRDEDIHIGKTETTIVSKGIFGRARNNSYRGLRTGASRAEGTNYTLRSMLSQSLGHTRFLHLLAEQLTIVDHEAATPDR